MAKTVNRLSDRTVKSLKEPGMYADGDGLYLVVDKSGAKRWTFVFQFNKTRKEMGLGAVSTVSLADARIDAAKQRKLVHDGVNPIEARKAAKAASVGQEKTFKMMAEEAIEGLKSGWTNPKSGKQWTDTLTTADYLDFINKPVAQVTTEDVVRSLKKIWLTIPTTARRIRSRVEYVFDVAKAAGFYTGENPARWRGHLKLLLPVQPEGEDEHHLALPYVEAPAFYQRLAAAEKIQSVVALQFTMLTLGRTTEILAARRREVDFQERLWIVPAERMKGRIEHEVPLVEAAIDLLKAHLPEKGDSDDFLFPGARENERAGKNLMSRRIELMGMDDKTTVHGLRSTFSDWAHDQTDFQEHIIEQCLAHVVGNKTKRAYRRGTALQKRRELLEMWVRYLMGQPAGAPALDIDQLVAADHG